MFYGFDPEGRDVDRTPIYKRLALQRRFRCSLGLDWQIQTDRPAGYRFGKRNPGRCGF